MGAFAAAVAPVLAALLVEEFCARTRGREYANTAAPITAATTTTLIRRKSFSVPVAFEVGTGLSSLRVNRSLCYAQFRAEFRDEFP
jgi:hypothetical protein